jgi:hypothetical protein
MDDRLGRARALVASALDAVEAELAAPRHGLCPVRHAHRLGRGKHRKAQQ